MSYPYKNHQSTEKSSKTTYSAQQNAYRPSQMQVGFPQEAPEQQNNPLATRAAQSTQRRPTNIQHSPPNPLMSSSQLRPEPTRIAAPTVGKSLIVRPGEPHHFGSSADTQRGEVICTLCRCRDPLSHGDAYTMLNSPRGTGIDGNPIDWQTAKLRMLDLYGKDQISHQEEIEAASHVYDKETAAIFLQHERKLQESVRAGMGFTINRQNNISWHMEGGQGRSRFDR